MIVLNILENLQREEEELKRMSGGWLLLVTNLSRKGKDLLITASLLVAALYLVHISLSAVGRSAPYQNLLAPRSEPFTALYFENSSHLPAQIVPGEKIDFAFTIANSEGSDRDYSYVVYFENGTNQKRIAVDQGTVAVGSNEKRTLAESYTFKQDHEKEILVVELTDYKQEIRFILTHPNHK